MRVSVKKFFRCFFWMFFLGAIASVHPVFATSADLLEEQEKFDSWSLTKHHISDANEFHIGGHVSVPLPVILYNTQNKKWTVTLSSAFKHGAKIIDGFTIDHYGVVQSTQGLEKATPLNTFGSNKKLFFDFSITKNAFTLILSAILLAIIFISVSIAYKKNKGKAPSGLQALLEPVIQFVIEEIAKPNLGHKYMKFVPYLMTAFFFIWINNLIGLVPFFPGSANVTGNIAVTLVLALCTLLVINFSANKHYWKHMFWMPGVPVPIKLMLMFIEPIGIIAKPFSLMIRLFANITAGHIIVLSLVCLIFVFGNAGDSLSGSVAGVALGVPFALFISVIELLVAFLQAFIFTMLSAVFIGMAVEDAHH